MSVVLGIVGALVVAKLARGRTMTARVSGAEKTVGLSQSLRNALAEWDVTGPFAIEVVSGVRTNEEQAALYAQGRTTPGQIVTYARTAYDSAHGRGAAVDLAVLRDGKRVYDAASLPLYAQLGAWFEQRGFVWGGRWKSKFPPNGDFPHVEVADWRNS